MTQAMQELITGVLKRNYSYNTRFCLLQSPQGRKLVCRDGILGMFITGDADLEKRVMDMLAYFENWDVIKETIPLPDTYKGWDDAAREKWYREQETL